MENLKTNINTVVDNPRERQIFTFEVNRQAYKFIYPEEYPTLNQIEDRAKILAKTISLANQKGLEAFESNKI